MENDLRFVHFGERAPHLQAVLIFHSITISVFLWRNLLGLKKEKVEDL